MTQDGLVVEFPSRELTSELRQLLVWSLYKCHYEISLECFKHPLEPVNNKNVSFSKRERSIWDFLFKGLFAGGMNNDFSLFIGLLTHLSCGFVVFFYSIVLYDVSCWSSSYCLYIAPY